MAEDYSVVVAAVVAVVAILGLVMMYGNGPTGAVSALDNIQCKPGEVLSSMTCDPETGACFNERHCVLVESLKSFS